MKMKQLAIIVLVFASISAHAEFVETMPSSQNIQMNTVQATQNMRDGYHVILEGYITGRAGHVDSKKFFFQDETGSLKVEIDDDVWRGQKVSPHTKVRIWGEVDRDSFNRAMEVEVDRLEIIQ
ncbi:YgiW/YdeI family stress tolerance OB fold protein [Wielerella bovis]|uniref:YgiW/YdeI family stress tolerance OB fold protein n=1 Tax=Wielerella bovis TaxID=2917790 RepID=UPI00201A0F63|nr:NirD/YgiW/YdeI family stress tolerance protein [Wielerella bovis]MCG7656942.1 NirD/YgiW/YdeI family stress tolerance protein [Wielerella bovis]MCG7659165.1 NirD/YgiW/YdeI family stress tolerance protein [Wielerella bovis]